MTTVYKNPWHKPNNPTYGPEYYKTDAKPREYKGYLIYNRIPGKPGRGCWDIVKDGICITQRAGDTNHGLNSVIDDLIANMEEKA
jgi:hypothetical protein